MHTRTKNRTAKKHISDYISIKLMHVKSVYKIKKRDDINTIMNLIIK